MRECYVGEAGEVVRQLDVVFGDVESRVATWRLCVGFVADVLDCAENW